MTTPKTADGPLTIRLSGAQLDASGATVPEGYFLDWDEYDEFVPVSALAEARATADAQMALRTLTLWEALEAELTRLVGLADRYAGPGPGSVGSLVDLQNVYGSFEVLRAILANPATAEPKP